MQKHTSLLSLIDKINYCHAFDKICTYFAVDSQDMRFLKIKGCNKHSFNYYYFLIWLQPFFFFFVAAIQQNLCLLFVARCKFTRFSLNLFLSCEIILSDKLTKLMLFLRKCHQGFIQKKIRLKTDPSEKSVTLKRTLHKIQ